MINPHITVKFITEFNQDIALVIQLTFGIHFLIKWFVIKDTTFKSLCIIVEINTINSWA